METNDMQLLCLFVAVCAAAVAASLWLREKEPIQPPPVKGKWLSKREREYDKKWKEFMAAQAKEIRTDKAPVPLAFVDTAQGTNMRDTKGMEIIEHFN